MTPTAYSSPGTLRRRVLDAARGLVARDGAATLQLRLIAAEVGSGVASLYYHFANKEALLAAVAASLCLSACVVAPLPGPPPAQYQGYQGEPEVVAPVAPPAPYAESITVAPAPGYIWIGGFWSWGGGRYAWNAGHWERPRPGYHWAPRSWAQGPHGWHQRGGRWER